jgi:GNAT superfamily N-acetyltransferase
MVVSPAIVFPKTAEQIVEAYFCYLQSLDSFRSELAPTHRNAELYAGVNFIPAWERKEPILFAVLDTRIIGATFTTLPDAALEYRIPYAVGHGTWVHQDFRRHGVAGLLIARVRDMLIEKGVKRQIGMAHGDNEPSKIAFGKMGFRIHGYVLSYDL